MSKLLSLSTQLGIFSGALDDIKAFVWKVVLVLIVVVLAIAFIKTPKVFLPVFCTVVGVALICLTAYSVIQLNYYYSASGGIYGVISGLYSTNTVEIAVDELKFNITDIEMTESDTDTYSATMMSEEILTLDSNSNYVMCVNGYPCYYNTYGTHYIQSKYSYTFYDNSLTEIMTDTLTINLAFYNNYTSFTLTTTGGYSAVKLWNNLFYNDGFVITLITTSYETNSDLSYSTDGDLSNYCVITFIDETNDTVDSNVYKIGDTIEFPTAEDTSKKYFIGWSLDSETVIDTTEYTATETVTFYAVFNSYCSLVLYDSYLSSSTTQYYKAGEVATLTLLDDVEALDGSHSFLGWTDSSGNLYTTTYTVNESTTLYAEYDNLCTLYFDTGLEPVYIEYCNSTFSLGSSSYWLVSSVAIAGSGSFEIYSSSSDRRLSNITCNDCDGTCYVTVSVGYDFHWTVTWTNCTYINLSISFSSSSMVVV